MTQSVVSGYLTCWYRVYQHLCGTKLGCWFVSLQTNKQKKRSGGPRSGRNPLLHGSSSIRKTDSLVRVHRNRQLRNVLFIMSSKTYITTHLLLTTRHHFWRGHLVDSCQTKQHSDTNEQTTTNNPNKTENIRSMETFLSKLHDSYYVLFTLHPLHNNICPQIIVKQKEQSVVVQHCRGYERLVQAYYCI